jgi:type III restriction enzyme
MPLRDLEYPVRHAPDAPVRVGELALVHPDGTTVECDLVLLTEWKTRLPGKFGG